MRMYGKQKTTVGRSVWRPVESVPTHFVGMAIYISTAIPEWVAERYLNWNISASSCVGTGQDIPGRVMWQQLP